MGIPGLWVRPGDAAVTIDGELWEARDETERL
jgi:hypothetical protein